MRVGAVVMIESSEKLGAPGYYGNIPSLALQSVDAAAERLRALDRSGKQHIMVDFRPNNERGLQRVIEGVRLSREA